MRLDELFEDDVDYSSLGSRIAKSLFGKYRNPKMKGGSLASGYGMGIKRPERRSGDVPKVEPKQEPKAKPRMSVRAATEPVYKRGQKISVGGVEHVWDGDQWLNPKGEPATPAIAAAIRKII